MEKHLLKENQGILKQWKKVSLGDLGYVARELKEVLEIPAAIFLGGLEGAGKTTLMQEFAKSFHWAQSVVSPTYCLVSEVGEMALADFYRVKGSEDIIYLELQEYLVGKKYFVVEWGLPYLGQIKREIGDHFFFYQLDIESEDLPLSPTSFRNYCLRSVS